MSILLITAPVMTVIVVSGHGRRHLRTDHQRGEQGSHNNGDSKNLKPHLNTLSIKSLPASTTYIRPIGVNLRINGDLAVVISF